MSGLSGIRSGAPAPMGNVEAASAPARNTSDLSTGHDSGGRTVSLWQSLKSGANSGMETLVAPGNAFLEAGDAMMDASWALAPLALASSVVGLIVGGVGMLLGGIGGAIGGLGSWLLGSTKENRSDATAKTADNFGSAGKALASRQAQPMHADSTSASTPVRARVVSVRTLTPEEVQDLRNKGASFVKAVPVHSTIGDSAFAMEQKRLNFNKSAAIVAGQ